MGKNMQGINDVVWDAHGRVPVIVQDAGTQTVLALGIMDRAALVTTLATGKATYRTPDIDPRGCAANGPLQMVTAVHLACDGRSILLKVQPAGPLCQTGAATCFEAVLSAEAASSRERQVLRDRRVLLSEPSEDEVAILWSPEAAEGA
jgi:phosphoribosyl-ATP pyrophosphohydrolase/phosphoribosyl-AMP cyclohydrolase